jgi:hypothetical protein
VSSGCGERRLGRKSESQVERKTIWRGWCYSFWFWMTLTACRFAARIAGARVLCLSGVNLSHAVLIRGNKKAAIATDARGEILPDGELIHQACGRPATRRRAAIPATTTRKDRASLSPTPGWRSHAYESNPQSIQRPVKLGLRPSDLVRFRNRLLTRAALIGAATVRERCMATAPYHTVGDLGALPP